MVDGETRGNDGCLDASEKVSSGVSEDIREGVMVAIVDCLKLKEEQKKALCGSTNLAKDFNLDSLDFVDLIMSLEEKFSVEISDEEAQKLETVDDICNYIGSKAGSA